MKAAQRTGRIAFDPGFVRSDAGEPAPPLARLVQGGQGGEVRLKLYLTFTMMATRKPYDITNRARTPQGWARLLGLPPREGARRVNAALKRLSNEELVELTPRPSAGPAIKLLNPLGSGPYTPPQSFYLGLPSEFWAKGWILDLTATGITLLMILLDALKGFDKTDSVPTWRKEQYHFSHGTWTRGRKELEAYGLLSTYPSVEGSDYSSVRRRTMYRLDLARLSSPSSANERQRARELLRRGPRTG